MPVNDPADKKRRRSADSESPTKGKVRLDLGIARSQVTARLVRRHCCEDAFIQVCRALKHLIVEGPKLRIIVGALCFLACDPNRWTV